MTNSINYPNQQYQQYPNQYSGVTINVTNPMMNAYPNGVTAPQNQPCNCGYCQSLYTNHYPQQPSVAPQYVNNHYVQYPQAQEVKYLEATRRYQPEMEQVPSIQYLEATRRYQPVASSEMMEYVSTDVKQYSPVYPVEPQYMQSQSHQAVQSVQPVQPLQSVPSVEPQVQSQNSVQAGPNQSMPQAQQAYPAQYYLNNYNILPGGVNNNGENAGTISTATNSYPQSVNNSDIPAQEVKMPLNNYSEQQTVQQKNYNRPDVGAVNPAVIPSYSVENEEEPVDMSVSQNIINELDTRAAIEKEKEANKEKIEVVALTNEYIKSLENYLNNPNKDIRLMAAKEVLTRLNEDRDRYDDAALNALLNKMMQDPDKLVRVAAMSAFSSGLACGNEFTVKLLKDIQENPDATEDDALEAANILLKMSETKETKYVNVAQVEAQE